MGKWVAGLQRRWSGGKEVAGWEPSGTGEVVGGRRDQVAREAEGSESWVAEAGCLPPVTSGHRVVPGLPPPSSTWAPLVPWLPGHGRRSWAVGCPLLKLPLPCPTHPLPCPALPAEEDGEGGVPRVAAGQQAEAHLDAEPRRGGWALQLLPLRCCCRRWWVLFCFGCASR